jgi:hypothetical protein
MSGKDGVTLKVRRPEDGRAGALDADMSGKDWGCPEGPEARGRPGGGPEGRHVRKGLGVPGKPGGPRTAGRGP